VNELLGCARGTDGGVENIYAVGSVIIEGFVYNIPCVALPLVMCNFVCDVILQGSNECGICPCPRSDWRC
jgi:hypothetical protein